jgi:ABC-type multidrug transport system permease subunit
MAIVALVGNSIGFFTGSLFQDVKKATSMAPVLLLPLMMFSGMYNKLNSIPSWIAWLQYISPFRYGLHMLLTNQYHDSVFTYTTSTYDYKQDLSISLNFGENVAVLGALSVLFYSCAFVLLKRSKQMISV